MRSHTGGMMTLGKGAIYGTSTRQKLNAKSSTESELIAVNDIMPQALWTRYFLESQGHEVKDSVIYQDNQSAILLEKNVSGSSGKRTRHINVRYFFVAYCIKKGDVSIKYCPTGENLADIFTKPLQGSLFKSFRNSILNISDPALNHQDGKEHRSVLGISHVGFHCWENQKFKFKFEFQTESRQD